MIHPNSAPIVKGSLAALLHLHLQGFTLEQGILLITLASSERQELSESDVQDLFGYTDREGRRNATKLMDSLEAKHMAHVHDTRGGSQAFMTLTEAGLIEVHAILGSIQIKAAGQ
jgi:hypothetical protein